LKSWSRSTIGRRVGERQDRAVLELLGVVRAGRQRDVTVGDARQRRRADDRAGATAQRRELVRDLDVDLGLVVVGEVDLAHRADAASADLHVVVLDELARVLEAQLVARLVAAPEQEHRDEHGGDASAASAMARATVTGGYEWDG
jgi:hypothetical protein